MSSGVKVMFEDAGSGEHTVDLPLSVALTTVVVLGLLVAIAMRGAATRVCHQQTLLGEAILLAESANSCIKPPDTQQ